MFSQFRSAELLSDWFQNPMTLRGSHVMQNASNLVCSTCFKFAPRHFPLRRTVSMATASALEGLGPMQRKDSMSVKMIKMFKRPDTHSSYLTSSRFALDIIKVRSWWLQSHRVKQIAWEFIINRNRSYIDYQRWCLNIKYWVCVKEGFSLTDTCGNCPFLWGISRIWCRQKTLKHT